MKSNVWRVGGSKGGRSMVRKAMVLSVVGVISSASAISLAQPKLDYRMPQAERGPDNRSGTPNLRWIINREECLEEGSYLQFNLTVSNYTLGEYYNYEVWGTTATGLNCTDPMDRNAASPDDPNYNVSNGRCSLITSGQVPQQQSPTLDLRLKIRDELLAKMTKGLAAECGRDSMDISVQPLNLNFMLTGGGNVITESLLQWPPQDVASTIDLWGPAAPTNVTASSGEGSLDLTVEGTSEPNSTVVVYCAKDGAILGEEAAASDSSCGCSNVGDDSGSAGSAGNATGGSAGSGGTNAGGASSSSASGTGGGGGSAGGGDSCNLDPLVPNEYPDEAWVPCAEGSKVEDLENGKIYAVAAAYRDPVGNVGKLSPIICATPAPIEDFFENYRHNGGTAGGGFCSIAPRTLRNTTFGTSFAVTALALAMRRLSRRSRQSRQSRFMSSKEVSK